MVIAASPLKAKLHRYGTCFRPASGLF